MTFGTTLVLGQLVKLVENSTITATIKVQLFRPLENCFFLKLQQFTENKTRSSLIFQSLPVTSLTTRFNNQKFYMVITLPLRVVCGSQNSNFFLIQN